jgi:hypothetical protein
MPSNIEIKARVTDFEYKCALAEKLSGSQPQIIAQRDTFFPCVHGRLKLRELSETEGQLIAYSRPDTTSAKQSDYLIFTTATPKLLLETLSAALGTSVVSRNTAGFTSWGRPASISMKSRGSARSWNWKSCSHPASRHLRGIALPRKSWGRLKSPRRTCSRAPMRI